MTLIKELKVKRKIKNIYLSDLLFIAGFTLLSWILRNTVATKVQIPFIIFNVIVAIILVMPSKWNPGKRMWQVMLFALKKDRAIYKPISVDLRSDDFD
ncbi:MAG: DUF5592 family protein [Eubacterium sp.]